MSYIPRTSAGKTATTAPHYGLFGEWSSGDMMNSPHDV